VTFDGSCSGLVLATSRFSVSPADVGFAVRSPAWWWREHAKHLHEAVVDVKVIGRGGKVLLATLVEVRYELNAYIVHSNIETPGVLRLACVL
jgi:hypothetical protein